MIFALNIVTKTRSNDAYKRVALNLYPIIARSDSLSDVLGSVEISNWINSTLRSRETYQNAFFCIRIIDQDVAQRDLEIPVSRYIEYSASSSGRTGDTKSSSH